jgi:hypothetical protein
MREVTVSAAVVSLLGVLLLVLLVSPPWQGQWEIEESVSSRSYSGHENDLDANNLAGAYPFLVGTRLDDCQTCHSGRMEEGRLVGSSCDYCHDLLLHGPGHTAVETLNEFGRDYLAAGRNREALHEIEGLDSDGDDVSNGEELSAGRYPGSQLSRPGQATANLLTVTLEELRALPSHRQFLLLNNTQQQLDDYVTFAGPTLEDLFAAQGIDFSGASGITVIAPDGYQKSLPIEYVTMDFPQPLFYAGLGTESMGGECGLVQYPESLLAGVEDGSPLAGPLRLLLGLEREGRPLDPATLDITEGKIMGEGPLRLVVPQENPGPPDRGSNFSPSDCGDGFDFREDADHNAGSMVRGVVAIRIDPMPPGVEEFDYMNGGWAFVEAGELILYGHGIG